MKSQHVLKNRTRERKEEPPKGERFPLNSLSNHARPYIVTSRRLPRIKPGKKPYFALFPDRERMEVSIRHVIFS